MQSYTEDQLVEQPAIRLFVELGWQTRLASHKCRARDLLLARLVSGQVSLS